MATVTADTPAERWRWETSKTGQECNPAESRAGRLGGAGKTDSLLSPSPCVSASCCLSLCLCLCHFSLILFSLFLYILWLSIFLCLHVIFFFLLVSVFVAVLLSFHLVRTCLEFNSAVHSLRVSSCNQYNLRCLFVLSFLSDASRRQPLLARRGCSAVLRSGSGSVWGHLECVGEALRRTWGWPTSEAAGRTFLITFCFPHMQS